MRRIFGITRILVACAGIIALAGDFNYSLGSNPLAIANFFSYFTVESALLAVAMFVVGGIFALRDRLDPLWLDMARLLVTVWIVVSGIVFAVILVEGNLRGVPVWAPWSSQLLHFWIPAYAVIDWLIAPARDVPWRTVGFVLLFPSVWVIYTMIRGAHVHWYPYFFLDPVLVAFPFEFALCLLGVIVIFTTVATAIIAISRLRLLESIRNRFGQPRVAQITVG